MIDVWSSTGVRLPRSIVAQQDVPLPMEEMAFLQLPLDEPPCSLLDRTSNSSESLLTQMVKLNTILVEINVANELAAQERIADTQLDDSVDLLTQKLDQWYRDLPNNLRDTPAN